jgi:hypothetical protein
MFDSMIRKQIYLTRRQDILLKRLAKERGVSEAEVIRQALEREAQSAMPALLGSKEALEQLIAFARSLRERPELMEGEPYQFTRAELYEKRENR